MNRPDPSQPGNREVPAQAHEGPDLAELMARVRREVTGSAEDPLLTPAHVARAEAGEPTADALSVDEVLERMRRELKRRRGGTSVSAAASTAPVPEEDRLPRWQSSTGTLPLQPQYTLAEMMRPSDGDFVDNAFRILLRRSAAATERAHYLATLRAGTSSKVEILGHIRFSDEGMQHGVHVDGLLVPYKLHQWRHIPVLGRFLALGIAIFRLPRLFGHLQRMEAVGAQEIHEVGQALNELALATETRQAQLDDQLDTLAGLQRRLHARLSEEMPALANAVDQLHRQLAEQVSLTAQIEATLTARLESALADQAEAYARLESMLAEQAAARSRLEQQLEAALSATTKAITDGASDRRTVHAVERRLVALSDRMNQQLVEPSPAAPAGSGEEPASDGLLDAHYVSFEDTFRGSREDIKTRAAHYLDAFREAGVEAGDGMVVDLGCGRGEWLEVLSEHGFASRGVDLNNVMVGEAQSLGLDAVEQDAVAHLRSLESDSVSAITSMHLVEHLPYEVLIRLVDEALRVLRPGGVLILETPNPENLTVGSYWFYMDPTHRNPIPPPLLQWVVEARGFEHAVIDRLTLNRGVMDIQPVNEDIAAANQINRIVGLLTAAPDYAIVARKPQAGIAHGQGA
ncbi:methyltransferase domain-containing protein [Rhodanobacter lindaniclasticus]|uniref:methyltransferase domain-containing protein n=1 Tax=Rhodanobacter lindaniclasticus TaxID=75310 RepID=UPI0010A04158|nr:methyltransferase domain-containing protein [Rhodanobacter lindaniclasticus]